jgi:hypothetical protein
MRSRSTQPKAAPSHATAARTSAYTSTGMTTLSGIERLRGAGDCIMGSSGLRVESAVAA